MPSTHAPSTSEPTPSSQVAQIPWGTQALKKHAPRLEQHWQRTARLRRRLALFAPCLFVLLVLLALAQAYYVRQGYSSKPQLGLAGFADIGSFSADRAGVGRLAVSPIGYDGQFYYFIAANPQVIGVCARTTAPPCPVLDAELRVERILYPITVWAVALGQPSNVPFALLLVNIVAILGSVVLVGQLCVEAGASRWLGAAAGLFCGEALGLLRDLADPFSVFWLVLAVYLFHKRRPLWGALAIAAALLSREQLLFIVPFLGIPLIAQRRWRTVALSAVIAFAPFALWQIALRVMYGAWALTTGDTTHAVLSPIPFSGLWQENQRRDFGLIVLTVAIPLILAAAIALLSLWRAGPRGLLQDPLPLIVLLYSLLVSLTGVLQWQDMWAPARLAAPAVVLAVIVVARLPHPTLRASYATLLAMTALAPLILTIR